MNGYVSINLNGTQRGLKFNMYAFELLSKRGSQFKEGETFTSQLTSTIVYCGMLANCWVKEIDPDFSFEDVTDWVENLWYDDEGQKSLLKVFTTFQESRPVQRGKEIVEKLDEEAKKKIDGDSYWDAIKSFAFGECGLLPSQYYNLTWKEFDLVARGYRSKMKHIEGLLRKHAVFVVSPYIKNVQDAYNAWVLEGEEKKPISSKLLKRLLDYKARDIINRKEPDYRKALIKWQKDSK